jgi:hypothetical protein
MTIFFIEDQNPAKLLVLLLNVEGMEAICPRCGEKGNVYSESSFLKIALSGEEKKFIFSLNPRICTYCIMQMKARHAINQHFHPYKKYADD